MDFSEIRTDFPITYSRSYLNAAASSPLSNRVVGAMNGVLGDMQLGGRNNAPHRTWFLHNVIRPNAAALLGAKSSEVSFAKNTTEGLNIVANGMDWQAGDNIVLANIEYPANVYCWLNLARFGVEIRWIDVKKQGGRVTVDAIREAVDSKTRLISVSTVQFLGGFRQDLEATGQFCRERKILLCYDAIQMAGAFPIDASLHHFDFLAAGGHKWLAGPMGTGLFYCRESAREFIRPANIGPGSIDQSDTDISYDIGKLRTDSRAFEEAVQNLPGLWGLNASITTLRQIGVDRIGKHILELTGHAIEGLQGAGYEITSPLAPEERSGVLSFRHPAIPSEQIRARLEQAGVDVTVRGADLRISPHFYNDLSDIDSLLREVPRQ